MVFIGSDPNESNVGRLGFFRRAARRQDRLSRPFRKANHADSLPTAPGLLEQLCCALEVPLHVFHSLLARERSVHQIECRIVTGHTPCEALMLLEQLEKGLSVQPVQAAWFIERQ